MQKAHVNISLSYIYILGRFTWCMKNMLVVERVFLLFWFKIPEFIQNGHLFYYLWNAQQRFKNNGESARIES